MTQKQQIQANNAELEKHKQDILSLPMADDVKNGKYVWGKYENSFHIMNPTFKAKCVNYNSLVIMESSFDFSQISNPLDFIVGFKSSNGKYSILKGVDGAHATDGSYQSDLTAFDGTKFTGFSVTNCCFANNEEVVFVYDGEKILSDKEKSFLAYTVSDLETAYPGSGEKDGYWYERVNGAKYGLLVDEASELGEPIRVKFIFPNITDSAFNGSVKLLKSVTHASIDTGTIGSQSFYDAFDSGSYHGKLNNLKVKCDNIKRQAFQRLNGFSDNETRVFLKNTIQKIESPSYATGAFYDASKNVKLYCEAPSKPSGWDTYWNYRLQSYTLTTMWGVTESQFDAL